MYSSDSRSGRVLSSWQFHVHRPLFGEQLAEHRCQWKPPFCGVTSPEQLAEEGLLVPGDDLTISRAKAELSNTESTDTLRSTKW